MAATEKYNPKDITFSLCCSVHAFSHQQGQCCSAKTLNNSHTTPVSINKTLVEHLSSMLFLNFNVLISTDTMSKAEFKLMLFALFVFTLLK